MKKSAMLIVGWLWSSAVVMGAAVEASTPQKVTLTIYDSGRTLVNELRQAKLAAGDNVVEIGPVPARLDPTSVSFTPVGGQTGLQIKEQQFVHDLATTERLFNRYLGEKITVSAGSGKAAGTLVGIPRKGRAASSHEPLTVQTEDGSAVAFLRPELLNGVTFPDAKNQAYLAPTLLWSAETKIDGLQQLRISYSVTGLKWWAGYEAVLAASGGEMSLSGRIGIENAAGGHFEDARVKVVLTDRGVLNVSRLNATQQRRNTPEPSALRYRYGERWPTFEQAAAGNAPADVYELPRRMTLSSGQVKLSELCNVGSMPVEKFLVYDGVKFDKFQRPRRNDWNYGTESHHTIETHLKFDNAERFGLGRGLPPGLFRLYVERDDGSLDLIGEDMMQPVAAGETGHVLLGAARGLRGEREQTGYAEVTPLHDYEESFEIRLENHTDESAEIRVVEHLYRWPEYEIVKADLEYVETEKQTIEFRPVLKPGGSRTIHYTVRYSW